jgi:hypothetical protein
MKPNIDRHAIAARIRGLIGGQDHGIIERTARRLEISEVTLRISTDELDPHPTLEVLDALVREYGVDPTWLMTGDYDAASHRRAIGEEADFARGSFGKLLGQRNTHASEKRGKNDDPNLKLEA